MLCKIQFLFSTLLLFQVGQGCPPTQPSSPVTTTTPRTTTTTTQTTTTTRQTSTSASTTFTPFDYSQWPCSIHENRTSRIYGGIDAPAGTFPFFVAVLEDDGEINAGVIVDSSYVLTQDKVAGVKIAHSLQPGDSQVDAFNSANPNIIDVEEIIPVPGNSKLSLLRLASPISYGPLARPAMISDCSGPSKPIIGESLAHFGLGYVAGTTYAETMQVKCGQVMTPTSNCINNADTFDMVDSICISTTTCWYDWGGPIVTIQNDQVYLVGITHLGVTSCGGKLFTY